jgi:hypothetical protein
MNLMPAWRNRCEASSEIRIWVFFARLDLGLHFTSYKVLA